MPTFGDLIGPFLRRELNQPLPANDPLFTSTVIAQATNDGYLEFAALTECWVRRSTLTVSDDVAEYVVSTIADFARVAKDGLPEYHQTSSGGYTTILAGHDFQRRDELWLNRFEPGWRQSTSQGNPMAWYLRNDAGRQVIGLDTRPDVGSSESAKLVFPYVARPEPMTASTQVPFTDTDGRTRVDLIEYHQAIAHYAAYKLFPLVGDTEGSQSQLQKFLGYVQRFLGNVRPKGGSHVTMARQYFGEVRRGRGDVREPWSPNYR
jgi:hypothetical protein